MEIKIFFFILLIFYTLKWYRAWKKTRDLHNKQKKNTSGNPFPVSCIVCIHNESKTLDRFLKDLSIQSGFDTHQWIFILDGCTDNSASILREWSARQTRAEICIIESPERQGKKKSILRGIEKARHSHIYLRDADTWLIGSNRQLIPETENPEDSSASMIAGLVLIYPEKSFCSWFQFYENLAMQVFTIYGIARQKPALVSAANLLVRKELFTEKNPYWDNLNIPGGDDMFLLDKIHLRPNSVKIDTTHGVYTYPKRNFYELFLQRIRWGSKTMFLKNSYHHRLALFVFISNTAIFLLPFIVKNGGVAVFFWVWKVLIDDLFLFLTLQIWGIKMHRGYLFLSSVVYPIYLPPVALISLIAHVVPKK